MVVIETLIVDGKQKPLYMDTELNYQLNNYVIPSVKKKDFDYVICVDGEEGVGKSVFGIQIAKVLDNNFSIKNICFTPEEFVSKIQTAKKNECILYDEGFGGLSSRSSLSQTNQLIVSNMMQMRQKNLFVIIILPSVFMLDRYCVLHRTKGLFHVYLDQDGRRGNWVYYNKERLKILWLLGKKLYDYRAVKYILDGVFHDQYMVNEKMYRGKKKAALEIESSLSYEENKYKTQRDKIFYILYTKKKFKQAELAELCKSAEIRIGQSTISKIIQQVEKNQERNIIFSPKNIPK